jgi:hypothetical protein
MIEWGKLIGTWSTRTAVVAIALFLVWKVAATLDVVPQLWAEMRAHRSYEGESLAVGRRSCRALQILAGLPADECDRPAASTAPGGHP